MDNETLQLPLLLSHMPTQNTNAVFATPRLLHTYTLVSNEQTTHNSFIVRAHKSLIFFCFYWNLFTQERTFAQKPQLQFAHNLIAFFFARPIRIYVILLFIENNDQLRRTEMTKNTTENKNRITFLFCDFSVQTWIRNWPPMKIILFIFFPQRAILYWRQYDASSGFVSNVWSQAVGHARTYCIRTTKTRENITFVMHWRSMRSAFSPSTEIFLFFVHSRFFDHSFIVLFVAIAVAAAIVMTPENWFTWNGTNAQASCMQRTTDRR